MTTNSLRAGTLSFGEERLGLSHKELGTHSIRSGFTMELYLAKVYPETIMIMGRWAIRSFLRYIRIQVSDISKGISTLKQSRLLQNTRNRSCLPHTCEKRNRPTNNEPKHTRMRTHNFLPLATALKWSPRKEIPRHCSYTLSSNMQIKFHFFYPWSQFPRIPDYAGGRGRF